MRIELGSDVVLTWHYVDDFACVLRVCSSVDPAVVLRRMAHLWARLDVPLALLKLELGQLGMMGVLVDSASMTVSLSPERLARISALLEAARLWSSCTEQELQSLCGVLLWAGRCVPAGRTFLSRLLFPLRGSDCPKVLAVTADMKEDIAWWSEFMASWNGVSLIPSSPWGHQLFTDATPEAGGACYGSACFNFRFPPAVSHHINYKELFTLALAVHAFAPLLAGSRQLLLCRCDNGAAVAQCNRRIGRSPEVAALLRSIHFAAARNDFSVRVQFILGADNGPADALSRFQMDRFRELVPSADPSPSRLPPFSVLDC